MEEIQSINISLEDHRFHGSCFDPEVIYNFIELKIAEIYDLGYVWGTWEEEQDENFETNPELREYCKKYENVYDILASTEHSHENGFRLETVTMEFTNGLYVSYGIQGNLNLWIDNEKLFYEYLNTILKQYGYLPEKIYEIVRKYPNRTVYINRPGLLSGVDEIKKETIKEKSVEGLI